ncbi:DDB1- and CUL4-associated factor 17-like isoform X1 [Penaeus chinensis]|uniref:DDB1- and CUL4-associated factor 17-like isoform X1 n=1 Tax=Penaeus chinensis TaxID=139456 RepID=UPI001FB771B3|nr:DDB1- and CUL4-associated factor 17-like isoform X1 [Penaeus chinensis]
MKSRRRKCVLHELRRREYGVPCPSWTSLQALRYCIFGPRRMWKQLLHVKENSSIEFCGDLLWTTKPSNADESVMQRICGDGHLLQMYKADLHPRPKEIKVYDVPDPVYRSSVPGQEYRPVIFALRKGNVLTRHDLEKGTVFNRIHLGQMQTKTLSMSLMDDVLIVKSPKLKIEPQTEYFFHFKVFQMHPFGLIASLNIHGSVFPDEEDKKKYGKMRDVEIHEGLLLVLTEKSFSLIYNAQEIIRMKSTSNDFQVIPDSIPYAKDMVLEAPPLLFAAYTHMDILGLGACPWAYIRAVSDCLLQVHELSSGELLEGGKVMWEDRNEQQVSPDYLMFHPDDSNKLIHIRTSKIRILAIKEKDGKRYLEEEFTYPVENKDMQIKDVAKYSRSGRLLKSKFEWDYSLNRALAFNVETELRILAILEAQRDENCRTHLVKVTFYDSYSYEFLDELDVSATVDGDIETNRLSVHMDRDILNIVVYKGNQYTIFSYRLKEKMQTEESAPDKLKVVKKVRERGICNRRSVSYAERDTENSESGNVRRRPRERSRRERTQGRKRRRRRAQEESSENEAEQDSDEWVP